MKVKVWYDAKRGHYVSNAGFVLAKNLSIHSHEAAKILVNWYKEQPEHEIWQIVENMWVSE